MIYTVTLNPAVDYNITLPTLKSGEINRATDENFHFGGKGVNLSLMLTRLGVENVAAGFIAGFSGKAIEEDLKQNRVKTDFYKVDGTTRVNIKIKNGETETEINGAGPTVTLKDVTLLMDAICEKSPKYVCLCGSLPPSLPSDTYKHMVSRFSEKGINTVVDTSGIALRHAVSASPFLIKPNLAELCYLAGTKLKTTADVQKAAENLQKLGARNILISMGSYGAIFLDEKGKFYSQPAPKIKAVNTVGAGDSLLAGFLSRYILKDVRSAIKMGVAAGSATAQTDGLATYSQIMQIFNDKS